MSIHDETRLKRLSFRAWRRGFREADLILGPFVDEHARDLTLEALDALEDLLAHPDQDLYAWIVEREAPPEGVDLAILTAIRQFRDTVHKLPGAVRGG
ncbi:MAG: succinate dehydrogenase assembly factor 2 [Phenylobacterium sp.]|uniref:FAD assembly factor SdhE n=1 Tax=Phenylobacterium sp. TaxID=1871053 RepID=UPI0025DAE9B3|nr:succinate dehydrogenase assembly factor 2 [Phenylobacterium sp.]MCA6227167.1 succinate dehydrogenase assembly factor 2 [Phenylobacterium sp.]MCA6233118.1 succinate dehydrogenase assembly factor 2 [Phenylobacterium sp.]MCA6234813.1 succinate dehydrogenase assembly factor 2 [Phenylobacterium sp.]MCA6248827.1 succinate dehydrogenase assembly factor 2 [Phenylobacterium sp.]MCA6252712.1 succinate dehydrogenase assembly factor 2 [Phenylobacterium sp.]